MKATFSKALAFLLAFVMVLSCFNGMTITAKAADTDAGEVTVTKNGDSIVIGNGYISREFSVAGGELSTVNITNKRTDGGDTVFTPGEGSEEFIIKTTKEDTGAISLPALDRTGWTATTDSQHNSSGDSDGPASNLLDGRTESIWHTNYGGGTGSGHQSYPYNVVISLNGAKTFQCFSYTPRQQGPDTNGNIKGYELWINTSDTALGITDAGWTKVAEGEFEYNGVNPIYVNLDQAYTATQVKLVATSSKNGQSFAGGAEFNLHADKAPVSTEDRSFAASDLELNGDPIVADTTATINGVEKTGKMITFNFKPYVHKGATFTISEVVVMYNGDHFMRKYMEIQCSNDQLAIDYIDLESLKVNDSDAQWTIPHVGGVVAMNEFKANLGQPIYIQGMFFGCEFPETDTQIEDGIGRMRYYTGKNFWRFGEDNQLTEDGKYVTWQTVAGAARSTDLQVLQADFFEYIYSIATPSEFRIQYNSWFDNMMHISDENILETFIEVDQELNNVEVRPLDSYVVDDGWINYNDTYVVDASRAGTTLNQSGFWEFNSKFPNELYPSSELANKFGSNFGLWLGPRGGYNFYGSLADIITKSNMGSKAGGSIDVADREYVKNLTDLFCDFQNRFKVNYWKWDGFADGGQYGHFPAADGVPGYANRHMTGGYNNMYHVTDLWEAWIQLMDMVRANAKENGIDNLWISLTCYTNPSPWFLQWANSVWMQCVYDQKDAGFGLTKMDKQLTYRDAMYYDFLVNHQFQFPLANIYNHDPIYGKEGTGMTTANVSDEDFQNYLYMQSTRGITFWELLISDSLMTGDKYEVAGEFLEWAEENSHILRNAKIFGGMPDITKLDNGNTSEAQAEAYGFSCFDANDGIIAIRNPHSSQAKTVSFTFDRIIGVPEDAGTLKYYLVHNYNMPAGSALTGEFTYGQTYEFTLQPNEVRVFQISKNGDTTAPKMDRAFSDGGKVITVRFDEKVVGDQFTVSGAEIASVERSADDVTYRITLTEAPEDKEVLTVTANGITDISGNACTETISLVYNTKNVVSAGAADAENSLRTEYGFTVQADVYTETAMVAVAQGDEYALGVNEDGKAYFTVNGATAVSDVTVNDGSTHTIIGVRENNGMLKLYVDGTLAGAAYKAENRYYAVEPAVITVAEQVASASVHDIAYGYDELDKATAEPQAGHVAIEDIEGTASSVDTSEPAYDKSVGSAFDGNYDTFWASVPDGTLADAYLIADLGGEYTISQVKYTKRVYNGSYNCTGNLLDYIIEVSTDGQNWTQVAAGPTVDGTTVIDFEPVPATHVRLRATQSYHWQESSANTVMTVAELEVFEYVEPETPKKYVAVNLEVGETGEYTDNTGNYEGADLTGLDTTVATVEVTGVTSYEYQLGDAVTSIESGKTYVLCNKVAQKLLRNTWADASVGGGGTDGLALSATTADFQEADCWTVTAVDGGYHVQDKDGKYLTVARGKAGVSDTAVVISLAYDGTDWTIGENGEYLNDFGGAHTVAAGWSDINDVNSQWNIYEVTAVEVGSTEIAITGVGEGKTSVQIGNTIYNITVTAASHTHVYDQQNTDEEYLATPADCENAATYYYSCSCGEKGTETFSHGEALGHDYGDPTFTWTDNTAKASFVCSRDASHVHEMDATVTSTTVEGDCLHKAVTTYVATVTFEEVTYTDTKIVEGNLGDHADENADGKCDVCGELLGVIRVAGANRWATALLVADEMKAALGDEKFDAIIIASGNDFADALAGSYLATVKNAPILLSYGGDNEKYAYLDNDNINYVKENLSEGGKVYILGGEKAVPTLYEDGLEGYDVVRLGGANRFETNILILEEAGIADGSEVLVCTSANFADSLSASATGKPILLVWNDRGVLYGNQPEFLEELKEKNCTFTILGGENAVSAKLADEVAKYGEVDRLAGNTRMETSVLVAEKYFDAPETAVLAYAWNYPDGLCGGALAYALKAPLILTMPKYEAAAVEYAAENDITTGYVLGGDGLIGDAEVRAIFAMDAEDEIILKN